MSTLLIIAAIIIAVIIIIVVIQRQTPVADSEIINISNDAVNSVNNSTYRNSVEQRIAELEQQLANATANANSTADANANANNNANANSSVNSADNTDASIDTSALLAMAAVDVTAAVSASDLASAIASDANTFAQTIGGIDAIFAYADESYDAATAARNAADAVKLATTYNDALAATQLTHEYSVNAINAANQVSELYDDALIRYNNALAIAQEAALAESRSIAVTYGAAKLAVNNARKYANDAYALANENNLMTGEIALFVGNVVDAANAAENGLPDGIYAMTLIDAEQLLASSKDHEAEADQMYRIVVGMVADALDAAEQARLLELQQRKAAAKLYADAAALSFVAASDSANNANNSSATAAAAAAMTVDGDSFGIIAYGHAEDARVFARVASTEKASAESSAGFAAASVDLGNIEAAESHATDAALAAERASAAEISAGISRDKAIAAAAEAQQRIDAAEAAAVAVARAAAEAAAAAAQEAADQQAAIDLAIAAEAELIRQQQELEAAAGLGLNPDANYGIKTGSSRALYVSPDTYTLDRCTNCTWQFVNVRDDLYHIVSGEMMLTAVPAITKSTQCTDEDCLWEIKEVSEGVVTIASVNHPGKFLSAMSIDPLAPDRHDDIEIADCSPTTPACTWRLIPM